MTREDPTNVENVKSLGQFSKTSLRGVYLFWTIRDFEGLKN